ncbi:MAG: insulinase family protein, partial [Bacteroidia bacterium]|nr:insulinase family protein [Bacteroidia bacterium]
NPEKTGFAHLFEHLMFGGSVNIPSYDKPLQKAGGENNAFTNNDFTDYYLTIPAENLETGFWLESDRMLCLDFSERSLEVQKNVVIEEFKQRYLNQPYGDIWLLIRPLAYKKHPYQWDTIGKDISHIENASLSDVKDFFYRYYAPNNAILCVAGNIEIEQVKHLTEKWFGMIEKRNVPQRNLTQEPLQKEQRKHEVTRDVPFDAIFKVYHMCSRTDTGFYAADLLSDILSGGQSSRLYQSLVKEKKLFGEINAYILGTLEPGLFVITGKLLERVNMNEAERAIENEIEQLSTHAISSIELEKVKNKAETAFAGFNINVLNKAMNLASYELTGDAEDLNKEIEKYSSVTIANTRDTAGKIFQPENCSTLYYYSEK